MNNFATK